MITMKKKLITSLIIAGIFTFSAISVHARELNMYINNQFVVRDIQTVGDFDMIPILDIAGELGYNCSFDGYNIRLYNGNQSFSFIMGNASVYDKNGKWFGLDVVPQYINGHVMIPANFLINVLCMPYTWDDVTKTIFINSNDVYNWLINTYEYKNTIYEKELVQSFRCLLNVPDDLDVTYEITSSYYWNAGNRYLTWIGFFYNDKCVAGVSFDTYTHEAVKDILPYVGI